MIYVVLGMHKSGTTLISQILHHSGINMVEDPSSGVSYDDGNKYERQSVLALNMDILGVIDDQVLDVAQSDSYGLTVEQRKIMKSIVVDCNKRFRSWGFKEPRATLTYALWESELPLHRIIAIYRSPAEIWPRFRWRGWRRLYKNPIRAWQFVSRWLEHNKLLVQYLRDTRMDFFLTDYRRFMLSDDEFRRLEAFVGINLKDMRKKALYRQKQPKSDILLSAILKVNGLFKQQTAKKVLADLDDLRKHS